MQREMCARALLGLICIFTVGVQAAPASPEVDLGARTNDRVADAPPVFNRHGDVIDGPDELYGYPSTYVLVRFKPGVAPSIDGGPMSTQRTDFDEAAAAWGVTHATPLLVVPARNEELADEYGLSRTYLLHTPEGTDTPALAEALSEFTSVVEFAEIDGIGGVAEIIPNDPDFNRLYGMHNTGQTGGTASAPDGLAACCALRGEASSTVVAGAVRAAQPRLHRREPKLRAGGMPKLKARACFPRR